MPVPINISLSPAEEVRCLTGLVSMSASFLAGTVGITGEALISCNKACTIAFKSFQKAAAGMQIVTAINLFGAGLGSACLPLTIVAGCVGLFSSVLISVIKDSVHDDNKKYLDYLDRTLNILARTINAVFVSIIIFSTSRTLGIVLPTIGILVLTGLNAIAIKNELYPKNNARNNSSVNNNPPVNLNDLW